MKKILKDIVRRAINRCVIFNRKTRIGRYFNEQMIDAFMSRTEEVRHAGLNFTFSTPNELSTWRAKTFLTKEPETLAWIDEMPQGSVFWDVGANVGLYSLYAAKKRQCNVWAFEPSVFNLELLARNINLNQLTDNICIVPLALSDQLRDSHLNMISTSWGGALSAFGSNIGFDGKKIDVSFKVRTIGLTMEDAVQRLLLPRPDYIKIDVDGIEHLILKGGANLLKNVKGILIEINDSLEEQSKDSQTFLFQSGLTLISKHHSAFTNQDLSIQCNNQIWLRTRPI